MSGAADKPMDTASRAAVMARTIITQDLAVNERELYSFLRTALQEAMRDQRHACAEAVLEVTDERSREEAHRLAMNAVEPRVPPRARRSL